MYMELIVIGGWAIDPDWVNFLELLENKPEGIPLAHWQPSTDFLTVIMGEGNCRLYMIKGMINKGGIDILVKRHPEKGEDEFVGIEVWGGIRGYLSRRYQKIIGRSYEAYRQNHNAGCEMFSVAEIMQLIEEEYESTADLGAIYKERIKEALRCQNPMVHIPLI
jgi:hypothetical protein